MTYSYNLFTRILAKLAGPIFLIMGLGVITLAILTANKSLASLLLTPIGLFFIYLFNYGRTKSLSFRHCFTIENNGIIITDRKTNDSLDMITWETIAYVRRRNGLQTLEFYDTTDKKILTIDFYLTGIRDFIQEIKDQGIEIRKNIW